MAGLLQAALTMLPRPRPDRLPEAAANVTATVDRARLARFQRVCGYPTSDRLPPTYPHVLGFEAALRLMSRTDFPFPVVGVVHVGNRITQHRALTSSDRLDLDIHAADLRPHPRGRQFDMVTVASVDGTEVWREHSTYLHRERAGGDAPGGGKGTDRENTDRPPAPAPHAIWRIGSDTGKAYASVSGDRNPIHTSRVGARLFGFPRTIAHGMWSKARCLAALEGRLPEKVEVEVAFKLPILLPATVGFTAGPDRFALHGAKDGRPHLAGTIRPAG